MVEDLELTVKRGQLLEDTKIKSEALKSASHKMKKSSRDVKVKMCLRKYMYWLIGFGVAALLILFLWLIF